MVCWQRLSSTFGHKVLHPALRADLARVGEAFGAHCFFLILLLLAIDLAQPIPCAAMDTSHEMVVAEGDLAAQAGLDMLKRGGNAVDAAVATSLALGVTNSGSCGLGGGGFMLIYWAQSHRLYGLDYRERAPLTAKAAMYVRNGKPDEELARSGPLAVAVPGELGGLDAALRRFGTMKFSVLATPAIKLARNGFPITPHMAADIRLTADKIAQDAGFHSVFFDDAGVPMEAGAIARNRNLAALLQRLGDDPVDGFYRGKAAHQIVDYMKQRGGLLTLTDLANYRPIWRTPISSGYRGYQIYTMPPPSSGGVVLEILAMMELEPLPAGLRVDSPPYLADLIPLMRQGFIDRAEYADPAFVKVPVAYLLSAHHIAEARAIALHRSGSPAIAVAHDHGTSNFCVVDHMGNVVVVTTTINTIFGAKMMIPELGLILNNEMDDFTVAPGIPNAFNLVQASANEVAPGKRPLSSMSPVIALKDGQPVLAAGASGGPTIISGVVQVLLDELGFHLDPKRAVAEPRIHDQAAPDMVLIEASLPAQTIAALERMGYRVKAVPELGAVNTIEIVPGGLRGAFDRRKGGGLAGD
jgi:gamma-glutamyltranspeptidase / glutathione hydrolase